MNLPNKLTILRVAMIPFFLVFLLLESIPHNNLWALIVFILASLTDINEAFQVGYDAVKAAEEGKTGMMITLNRNGDDPYQCGTSAYDIHAIANVERPVPAEWITEDGCDVNEGYINYARPLIMGELQPLFVNGVPRHLVRK